MALIEIDLPPGIYQNGTQYQQRNRCRDANLMRWRNGSLLPIGGWKPHSTSAVTGSARAIVTWRDLEGEAQIAIGTESHLYSMTRSGALTDITPTGYVAGRASATTGSGYGTLTYGSGSYGTVRPDTTSILDATVWSLDNFGQDLLAITPDDNRLYEWSPSTGGLAAPVVNAPNGSALVVTAERFPFVLGAGGDPRLVQWPDQEDDTDWTPSTTNQAGQFPLQTAGRLMCGRRGQGETLLWTDADLWAAQYIGFPLVYGFQQRGSGCGVISRGAAVVLKSMAVWMGPNGFYIYTGVVQDLPCDVSDALFNGGINVQQVSKITAFDNSAFNEVWWYYPSTSSVENDSYVFWNYVENHWGIGKVSRLSAANRGVFQIPLEMGPDGLVYEHEVGTNWDGAQPFVRRGALQIGVGDRFGRCTTIIPDSDSKGAYQVTFYTKDYPNGIETARGPYTLAYNDDVRWEARMAEVLFTCVSGQQTQLGTARLDVRPGSGR